RGRPRHRAGRGAGVPPRRRISCPVHGGRAYGLRPARRDRGCAAQAATQDLYARVRGADRRRAGHRRDLRNARRHGGALRGAARRQGDLDRRSGGDRFDRQCRARPLLPRARRRGGRSGAGAWREGRGDRRRAGAAHQGQAAALRLRPAVRREGPFPADDGQAARQAHHPSPARPVRGRRRLCPGARTL
ncbi:hypothetical protein LTR94_029491, partial [Friedmanniomyces endolithicus]